MLPYVLVVLALMGLVYAGWWVWVAMIFFLGRHPIGQTLSVKQMIQTHALHQVQHIRELASALPAH